MISGVMPAIFDVHLQRRDAVRSTSHFEVHVAEVIFIAKDVGQDRIGTVFFQDQTHRNTSNRRLERNTRIHHRQEPPQTDAIEDEPLDSVISDTTRTVYGKSVAAGKNRLKRTPSQLTVTDFATTRRAHATSFTNRIGWEVVVQQEVGFEVAVQRVDELLVVSGAQSGHNQTLCFTACEQGRAVCTWQQTGLANDSADFIRRTTIDALARFHNVAAQDASFKPFIAETKVRICIAALRSRRP